MNEAHPAPFVITTLRKRRRPVRMALIGAGAAGLLVLAGVAGYALAPANGATSNSSSVAIPALMPQRTSPYGSQSDGSQFGGTGTSESTTQTAAVAATDAQKVGVVTILTNVDYGAGEAAGTGMILSSDGTILTNNHVVEGATSIEVTVESTGATYTADVVGTDATDDIAVLQLEGASGLDTVTIDNDSLAVGDAVTAIGNAEGTGDLVAAAGSVTDFSQSITVADELTGASKTLNDLIEVNADVVSGDSGGPLMDSEGEVVGITTAASSGSSVVTGFAIPIATAIDIADQIQAGTANANIQLGLPAFLGVQLANSSASGSAAAATGSATVGGVIEGSPAATAGLAAGDVITAVDGTAVASATELSAAIAAHAVGDSVVISYTDATGAASSVTVTLVGGPAA